MSRSTNRPETLRDHLITAAALLALLALGALAVIGPAGILTWGEDAALLQQHQARIAELQQRGDTLKNRVRLLDPDKVDADLASELVRGNLNVAHPDEYVIELPE